MLNAACIRIALPTRWVTSELRRRFMACSGLHDDAHRQQTRIGTASARALAARVNLIRLRKRARTAATCTSTWFVVCLIAACPSTPEIECDEAFLLEPIVDANGLDQLGASELSAGIELCVDDWNRVAPSPCLTSTLVDECADCGPCAGFCAQRVGTGCECHEACTTDDICGDDEACLCAAAVIGDGGGLRRANELHKCLPAACRTSDDCGGDPCGISQDTCSNPVGLFCRGSADKCGATAPCVEGRCAFDPGVGHWRCFLGESCE